MCHRDDDSAVASLSIARSLADDSGKLDRQAMLKGRPASTILDSAACPDARKLDEHTRRKLRTLALVAPTSEDAFERRLVD
jgi:hypothetical protein